MDLRRQESLAGDPRSNAFRVPFPDEFIRPLAHYQAQVRPGAADRLDENWFVAKVQAFEQPHRVVEYFEADPNRFVTLLRAPSVGAAYATVRQWREQHAALGGTKPTVGGAASASTGSSEIFPEDWIRLVAYRRYEERGREQGRDKEDWFAAKSQLFELFFPLMQRDVWTQELWNSLCSKPLDQAALYLRELTWKPAMRATVRQVPLHSPQEPPMQRPIRTNDDPSPVDAEHADQCASPVLGLSAEEFNRHRGYLVALLADGPEKGKVIARAPLDFETPSKPRVAIRSQVEQSPYRERRYQVRQILDDHLQK